MLIGKANSEILSLKMFPTMFSKELPLWKVYLYLNKFFFFLDKSLGYLNNDKFYSNEQIRHLKMFARVEPAGRMLSP